MHNIENIYEKRKRHYDTFLKKQKNTINFISALRLIIFLSGFGFSIFFIFHKHFYISSAILIVSLISFVLLVDKHGKIIMNRNLTQALYDVNETSIKRIKGQWKEFIDTGEEFNNPEHSYSDDLDVFGKSSLFQWLNTASTTSGRERLSELLSNADLNKDEIIQRQQSIKELVNKISLRQRLNAEGNLINISKQNIQELLVWSGLKVQLVDKFYFKLMLIIMPIITCGSIAYYFLKPGTGYALPLIFIAVNIVILKLGEKVRDEVLETAFYYKNNIKSYERMIKLIEKHKYKSKLLKDLQGNLNCRNGIRASEAIKKLTNINSKISDRKNLFSIILNVLLLWDYNLIISLEKWKRQYGKDLEGWLKVIGEFEALSSLSGIFFDNPEWCMPVFNETMEIKARSLAHPLLPYSRVSNDVIMGDKANILLITGSNMSGKSTFLRTIGINLVLAYAGAPVCAEEFNCSLMSIYTCMRIGDNLEKSISSFYAEILRIKMIVQAVSEGKPIFFLLDEIFKGTNSIDRHLGAETLINRLSEDNALGLVSTHDLELGSLEDKNNKVKNYHFLEHYKDNEIYFDYKLREGISTTRNAIYLMKMAGIKFDE
ncbi:MutS domain V protein [Clostridiales bacterium oral taxon 876 str. F0540]|nr:MutS domain V protein [Clostridiales bacterium oral taxon 876 str. F0540]